MINDFSDLWGVLLSTMIIFIVLILIFRKHLVHILDPLVYYIITQAFSIQLAFMTITDTKLLVNFLLCESFFLFGFFFAVGSPLKKIDKLNGIFFRKVKPTQISVLKWYAIVATIILVIANLILIKQKGIALFSDDPSKAKVDNFTEGTGLGIVRRLNSSLLYIVAVILIFLFIYKKQLRYLLLTSVLIMFEGFSGSKSALLFFVFLSAFFYCFKDFNADDLVKKIKVGSYVLLGLAFCLVVIILTSGGADSFNDVLLHLGTRFLFYGDAMLYYMNSDSIRYFSNNNFFSFLKDEFNSVLGLLRIVPYSMSINFRLIDYYYNMPTNETFGPNIPFYIKGNIYFGFIGSFFYSFFIGAFVGFIRRLFYSVVRNRSSSVILSIVIIYLNLIVYSLPQDSPLFIDKISDIIFFSVPLLFAVFLIHFPADKNQYALKAT